MKLKYLPILLLSCFNAFSQRNSKISFEEHQADSIEKKIDSILLIGIGSTTTRIFLDELSHEFTKGLSDGGVVTQYCYLGKDITQVRSEYNKINKDGFKAILFFLPADESSFDVQGTLQRITTPPTILGPMKMTMATSKTYWQQNFNFQLYLPDRDMTRIWTASVEVSGDLAKSRNPKYVGNKLLFYFKRNKYLKKPDLH
jgi:hypothetical protein